MDIQLDELLKNYNVATEKELIELKSTSKQNKIFSNKPDQIKLTEDECEKLCEAIGLQYLPGYENRVLQYIITQEATDRHGDIVRVNGAMLDNYKKNPIMQPSHNSSLTPIGNTLRIKINKGEKNITALGLFADERTDTSGVSDLYFRMAQSGFMRACSIGFSPLEAYRPSTESERTKLGLGQYGIEYKKWDLLEWSPCSVPANPGALQNYFKGIDIGNIKISTSDFDNIFNLNIFNDELFSELKNIVIGKKVDFFDFGKVKDGDTLTEENKNVTINLTDVNGSVVIMDRNEFKKIEDKIFDLEKKIESLAKSHGGQEPSAGEHREDCNLYGDEENLLDEPNL